MHAVLVWAFPVYLIIVEMIFRTAFHQQDTTGFIGPAIATAGLTSLISLTRLKKPDVQLSDDTKKILEKHKLIPVNAGDIALVTVVWMSVLVGFLVWLWSCTSSLEEPTAKWLFVPKHIGIGAINYFVAIFCAAWKHYL